MFRLIHAASIMSDYRRYFVPGGTYFFTVVTHLRRPILVDDVSRTCLREAFVEILATYPFEINAIVLLPEHMHAIWTLPPKDDKYSMRWRRIKEEFTKRFLASGGAEGVSQHHVDVATNEESGNVDFGSTPYRTKMIWTDISITFIGIQ